MIRSTGSLTSVLALCLGLAAPVPGLAFCGLYVARAGADLFNEASQVVLARDGERTVITMSSDFQGDVQDFAMVVPVPSLIQRQQINVGDAGDIAHLDRYTAPRMVEYNDPDPCAPAIALSDGIRALAKGSIARESAPAPAPQSLGVRIEARYSVGEYDILILSADESEGLVQWLIGNGYRIPRGAEAVIASYLARDMRFFVAKVNLERHASAGKQQLRPLQIAYESRRFMLPIRLGMVNARGRQELFVYTLTRNGRVETTNYRTVRLPTGQQIPVQMKSRFGEFYTAMFRQQARSQDHKAVFLEYAWDMGWCDPCAADPLSPEQLRTLGAYWVAPGQGNRQRNVFVTRLHLRYDAEGFPEDLMLHETRDRTNFQGRYVIRHPFVGAAACREGQHYLNVELPERFRLERETLAELTGWGASEMDEKVPVSDAGQSTQPWWQRLWSR